MRRDSARIVVFIAFASGAFTYIGNAIPQIKSEPVVEEGGEIGGTPEQLTAAGRKIAERESSQCLTCHSIGEDPKARCPDWKQTAALAGERKPGTPAAAYLVESAYDPNAFVLSGYPKDQMRPIDRPPIALSHDQIKAVLCYIRSLEVPVDEAFVGEIDEAQDGWRKGLLKPSEGGDEAAKLPILPGDAARGAEVFRGAAACIKCHRVGAEGKDVGPELTTVGGSQGAEYFLESILDPSAVIVKGYGTTTVVLKGDIWRTGVVRAWVPNKERPLKLLLEQVEGTETYQFEFSIDEIDMVGDAKIIGPEDEEEEVSPKYVGEYVEGTPETGITLRMLDGGRWVERRFGPAEIDAFMGATSPMPSNFGDILTVREMYDLVAYLESLK